MRNPEEQALSRDFGVEYERLQNDTLRGLERNVCGCDYGGTSWTTQKEAAHLCSLLNLAPGRQLLEVGSGSGWPALYLSAETGCDVTLVDIPHEAIRIALARAVRDGMQERCHVAVADGAAMPLCEQNFHAISHSDVLCCLDQKLQVLEECRRVIRSDGRMVFTAISITPGLSPADHEYAAEFGPPYVEALPDYPDMLKESRWHVRHREDLTQAYLQTSTCYLQELEARRDDITKLAGGSKTDERIERTRSKIEVIKMGLLRRHLYSCVPE